MKFEFSIQSSTNWSKNEDETLLDILIKVVNVGLRGGNESFKTNTLTATETKLEEKLR